MTDYFVSGTGNDGAAGTSPDAAWRGIQKGLNALSAGDTLNIMEGEYDPGMEGRGSWYLSNKRGAGAGQVITIRNNSTDNVVLTGRDTGGNSGYPSGPYSPANLRPCIYNGVTYQVTYAPLLQVTDCSYVTFQGIHFKDSMGRHMNIFGSGSHAHYTDKYLGASGATSRACKTHHITIDNCIFDSSRTEPIVCKNVWDIEVKDSEFYLGYWAANAGAGGPNFSSCFYVNFHHNLVHECTGEPFICDTNYGYSSHVLFTNNVFYDNWRQAPYFHASSYVVAAGNLICRTAQDDAIGGGYSISSNDGRTKGGWDSGGYSAIHVNAREADYPSLQNGCSYVLVTSNILHGAGNGVNITALRAGNSVVQKMQYIYVINNVALNNSSRNYRWYTAKPTLSNCVFKNNISVHSNAARHLEAYGNPTTVDADYNLYQGSTPSKPSNLDGANDQDNVSAGFINQTSFNKPEPTKRHDRSGWWVSGLSTKTVYEWLNEAAGYAIISSTNAKDAGTTITAPAGWNSDSYGYDDMSDWVDKAFDFAGTGTNPTRTGNWDIGAHEFQSLSAAFSASPTSGNSQLSVTFNDQSTPQEVITSRFWDFGDGFVSTEKNPVHEYKQGVYTVSLRVAGDAGTDIETQSNLITSVADDRSSVDRVTAGLVILYRFDEAAGNTIYDVSGIGAPLDLRISDPSAVNWLSQGIEIASPTILVSNGPASKISGAIRESNEFTIEVWIRPHNMYQDGPARIISISKNMHSRNVTLGQGLWGTQPSDIYDVRLRTTERSANGMPSFSSPTGTVEKRKTHLVFLRRQGGRARFLVDGTIVAETTIPGDLSTWNPRFPLLMGNETTGDYPWRGQIYLVAVYRKALANAEIRQNFAAGTEKATQQSLIHQPAALTTPFRRFVLVKNGIEHAFTESTTKALAYGVEYPDKRCVLRANGKTSSMAIYRDVNAIVRAYGKQGLKIEWLD
jgi:PKD repeat protein